VERDHDEAGERIRGGEVFDAPPTQLDFGVTHQALKFALYFADGRIGMPAVESHDKRHTSRRECGRGRCDKGKQCANNEAHTLPPDWGDK
jgi:hypothetical protein